MASERVSSAELWYRVLVAYGEAGIPIQMDPQTGCMTANPAGSPRTRDLPALPVRDQEDVDG